MAITFKKISVIGLGLIGTSILHAIKEKADKQIITMAYDINPDHRALVKKMKIASFVFEDIKKVIKDADLIILSIPVGKMSDAAKLIAPYIKKMQLLLIQVQLRDLLLKILTLIYQIMFISYLLIH